MAYHADVRYLEGCNPALIERNASEFTRVRDLLVSLEQTATTARHHTVWESAHRHHYDARLADVHRLVAELCLGFDAARRALLRYADEVERARQWLRWGVEAESQLDTLISSVAVAITRDHQQAEPMRRWEDLRQTTGFLDWYAELGVDVERIRQAADRCHQQAGDAFGRALSIEQAAREDCVAALRRAHDELPDFRGDFRAAAGMIADLAPLQEEIRQAQQAPGSRLPGGGLPDNGFPAGDNRVSPALQQIREVAATLPAGVSPWQHEVVGSWSEQAHRDFVTANRELIRVAAHQSGLPADLLAAITWRESAGKPYVLDDAAALVREAANAEWSPVTPDNLPGRFGGSPDETSFGPLSVQLRRAAEVLGYNPDALSGDQRDEITSALRDPTQNLFIAARYLENLKAESGLAEVPTDQLTTQHYQELAARYNGGPYWLSTHSQDYGNDIVSLLDGARAALR